MRSAHPGVMSKKSSTCSRSSSEFDSKRILPQIAQITPMSLPSYCPLLRTPVPLANSCHAGLVRTLLIFQAIRMVSGMLLEDRHVETQSIRCRRSAPGLCDNCVRPDELG